MSTVPYDSIQTRKKAEEIRYNLVAMMDYAGSGHPGGSLSIVEIMSTLFYGGVLKQDPQNPKDDNHDRLILSKGHASPTLYVILADLGYFPAEKLKEFDANDSMLPKHCNRMKTPGVEASTGALGQGVSMALGMAMASRIEEGRDYQTYCVVGDGECQSGEVWEAAMAAAKFGLDNFKVIVDDNGLQIDGDTADIMPLGSLRDKWEAFGWYVQECDGHDVGQIKEALLKMNGIKNRPQVLIAKTIKGKGVSFMENIADWHSRKITKEEGVKALKEITQEYEALGFQNIEESILFLNEGELENLLLGESH
jgi:transketolase